MFDHTHTDQNVIAFPQTFIQTQPARPNRPSREDDQVFYLRDKVQFKSDNVTGVVVDGKPNFGTDNRWMYSILQLDGPQRGTIRMARADRIMLRDRSLS